MLRCFPPGLKAVLAFMFFNPVVISAQPADTWTIKAAKIDPSNYYGITAANGMIGIVSSHEPFKVKMWCWQGLMIYTAAEG
ncbi:MAG: hypothetical protein HC867_09145 [Bacteroidia bacterium]|nr:hypothetical protein [Bacteroidia bacterium]